MPDATPSETAIAPGLSRVSTSSAQVKRPCPVCENSDRKQFQRWCAIPEFEVLRCRLCGVIFINEVITDNFGFGADPQVAESPSLAAKAADDFRLVKKTLLAIPRLKQGREVSLLDVGCGMGTFLLQARASGWKVTGLELSAAEAAYAREQRALTVRERSIEAKTEFAPGFFDVITLFGVIEHLANPKTAIEECARLLAGDGLLVVQTPAEDGFMRRFGHLLYSASFGLINFQVKQLYQMGGGHSVCFNRQSINELMRRCGLEILRVEPSTYGLGILMMRFRGMPWPKRFAYSVGTAALFLLSRVLGSNHMTVYASKRKTSAAPFLSGPCPQTSTRNSN